MIEATCPICKKVFTSFDLASKCRDEHVAKHNAYMEENKEQQ